MSGKLRTRLPVNGRLLLAHVMPQRYRAHMVDDIDILRAANLLVVLTWVAAPVVLSGSTLAQNAQQSPVPVVSQSACSDTIRDVDRIACVVSAPPEPVPAQRPPPPLLRGSDGITIIGPTSPR